MKNNSSETGRQFYIPIVLTIITIVLGLISFHTVFPDYPFSRKLYYTFQLFTLESGDRFYENGTQSFWVTFTFNLARFLAIATLIATIVLAILSVLRYKYYLSRVRFMKDHTILCGLGGIGKALAENFPDKKKLVIIEKDASNENLVSLKKDGAKIIEANALDIMVMKKIGIMNAKYLFALTGDDFGNLTIIKYIREQTKGKSNIAQKVSLAANIDSRNLKASVTEEWKNSIENQDCELKDNLTVFCDTAKKIIVQRDNQVTISELQEKLKKTKINLLNYDPPKEDFKNETKNLKLFNINQLAARSIFIDYPPDRFRSIMEIEDTPVQILFLGYSQVGEELFKLCVQNCHFINQQNTKITLICLDADIIEDNIKSLYKNVLNIIDFCAIKYNPHHLTNKFMVQNGLTNIDVIYICSNEDRYQASYSSRARELYGEKVPIVRPFYKNTIMGQDETFKNFYSFNIFSQVANIKYIIGETLDRKAISVHHRWLKKAIAHYIEDVDDCIIKNKIIPEPKSTIVPWYLLDEEFRNDNRSVVDYINIILRTTGQLNDPAHYRHPENADINFAFLDNNSLVDQLSEMEHRRWMATKYLYGWEYGQQRNETLKEHEYLLDYNKLDENTKDCDRNQIKSIKEIIGMK
jgi:hypothetical protein